MRRVLACLVGFLLVTPAGWSQPLSDQQIKELIIQQSISSYSGSCPCPYSVDRAGRSCGKRSAWSRAGGDAPLCYASEVTDEMVRKFRERGSGDRP
jgi:hypothetical protein